MITTTSFKESWKADKANLHTAISNLKKNISDFKEERKLEWKTFKSKYNNDLDSLEESLKKLIRRKKK